MDAVVPELYLLESCPAVAASSGSRTSCGGAGRRATLCLCLLLLHAHPGRMNALIFIRGAQVVLVCQSWMQLPKAALQMRYDVCCDAKSCYVRSCRQLLPSAAIVCKAHSGHRAGQ